MSRNGDTSQRILEAARKLFMAHGYVGTKTRLIAQHAGTSESGILRYFNGKYALLTAVYNDAWKRLNEHIDATLDTRPTYSDPREELIAVITAVWSFYEADRTASTFLIINTGNTDSLLVDHQEQATIWEENKAYVSRIERLCLKGAQKHLLGDISPRAMSEGLLGLSEGVLLGWYLHDRGGSGDYPSKVTIDDARKMLTKLLY